MVHYNSRKYVRDSEREQLSRQALTLCLQSLRTRVQSMGPPNAADNALLFRTDLRTHVLLDVYKIYQQIQKNFQGKEVQAFATLLVDTYKAYKGIKTAEGNVLEVAMRCCQQQALANKIAASHSPHTHHAVTNLPAVTPIVTSATVAPATQSQPVSTSANIFPQRKPYKTAGTGRPRGRPPNINKYLQGLQAGSVLNQLNAKRSGFGNYMPPTTSQPLMNPFFMNPLMDQSMMSAMLAAGLNSNMMDPLAAANYLSQIGGYQDILRQYQNNLSSISNLANYGNLATSLPSVSNIPPTSLGNMSSMSLAVQQLLNLNSSTPSTTTNSVMMYPQSTAKITPSTSTTKDISHGISITPVSNVMQHKSKSALSKTMQAPQPPKAIPAHLPTTQVSLLKPSVLQQTKITPPKQISAPQIRVSKSLTEPQPAHSASLSPLKSTSPSSLVNIQQSIQNPGLNITPVNMGMAPRPSGTSLQHKLQLKKQAQPITQNPVKKHRPTNKLPKHQGLPQDLQNLLNMSSVTPMSGTSYITNERSGLSVSAVNQSIAQKISSNKSTSLRKISNKDKPLPIDMSAPMMKPLAAVSSAETLNMLSQLQQHSHLEIIPQSKSHKQNVDYPKNPPPSLSVVPTKTMDNLRTASTEGFLESSRKSNSSPKKIDKHPKDNVEIITLDD